MKRCTPDYKYEYDAEYLGRLADGWTRISYPIISRRVLRVLEAHSPREILDFGAGAGTYGSLLASRGARVSACDISQDCLESCRGRYAETFLITGARDLPSGRFDMVFSTEVLEHVEDWRETLRHIHRSLTPGGVFLMTTTTYAPSVFAMLNRQRGLGAGVGGMFRETGRWAAGFLSGARRDEFVRRWCFEATGGHLHGFRMRELKRALSGAGMRVESSGVFHAVEPIHLPFLYANKLRDLIGDRRRPVPRRCAVVLLYAAAWTANRVFRVCRLFANNVFLAARRD